MSNSDEQALLAELAMDVRALRQSNLELMARVVQVEERTSALIHEQVSRCNTIEDTAEDIRKLMRDGTATTPSLLARVLMIEGLVKHLATEQLEQKALVAVNRQLMWALIIAVFGNVLGAVWSFLIKP